MIKYHVRTAAGLLLVILLGCGEDKNAFQVEVVAGPSEGKAIEMVALPGGTYMMGSDEFPVQDIDTVSYNPIIVDTVINIERPVHVVMISPFMIGAAEITQEQYESVMHVNPSRYRVEADMPVERVAWYDAAAFCNALSDQLGYQRCYNSDFTCDYEANGFRLPTESEWEYAARGGTGTVYYFGDDASGLSQAGWFATNSELRPHTVAGKQPNAYGLYDMHGNVSEWCQDWYDYYNCNSQFDPPGPSGGALKVARGGSWAGTVKDCRTATRFGFLPTTAIATVGFRIVRRP